MTSTTLLSQRRPWLIILVSLALLLAACGSSSSRPVTTNPTGQKSVPTRSKPNPPTVPTSATQAGCALGALGATMSGHLAKSCYRIPNLRSGTYYLGVEAVLSPRGTAANKEGISVPSGHSGPAVSLSVSPTSVVPGARVTITGRVSTPLSPQPAHTNVCFDGCVDGLHYNGTSVHWVSSTEFQTSFVTPSGPWLERYPLRLLAPRAGSYPISIQCLGVHRACALAHGEGSTALSFKRSVAVVVPRLSLSSKTLIPGEMTPVGGTIALTNIIGTHEPFVDQFDVLKRRPSREVARGVYQFSQPKSGTGNFVLLGAVGFKVATPVSYRSISLRGATNIQLSADPSIFTESGTNGVALSCVGQNNTLEMLDNGHITKINTAGVSKLLEQAGVPSSNANSATCATELAAVQTPTGKTLIAASYPIEIPNKAPDFAYLPVISANDGGTWSVIPSPQGISNANFVGLQSSQFLIHAYFTLTHHAEITETTTNGTSWTQGRMLCPHFGPCVRFSPTTTLSNCAMNGAQQPILLSTDQGREFMQSSWPSSANACATNELFSVHGTEYLIDPQSSYPLRRSTNGGVSWQVVSDIPTPPGVQATATFSLPPTSWDQTTLVIPETGDLLRIGSGTGSSLLAPRAHHWCNIATTTIPKNVGAAVTGRHNLYFVTYSSSNTSTFRSIPLASLHCAS
ncbi:hypothetical protein [Ferrimicrobium acidiphilum]|uniref:hypothetical protein n=1 Tax=Ferrimicrobium acidiphilum TaxID=121039 RepID=UPI0023F0B010|nr:hypothetical protein [Ferrimicrobium acidiphilum]